ncbi:UDP-glucuronosyltransferase 2C1-like isoform X2 [Zootermopsis nevadensis]|uniref:UDP-glucuronosyltransferase 2C1 n=1 Tax=Zootermopsis nevadensis TaxID=136037 RepID=A0A067R1S8_ZOONE|nr:UDP-glucuronosyltransferase 2C1-like isoform X2 [Zootermopsis nevadensis]KDR11536.1 UDP-glucuronosyltransferase 2C1 [Zootermopsis nevadensis]
MIILQCFTLHGMFPLWIVILAQLLVAPWSHGARILGVFPFPARSHVFVLRALMLELADRGHEVTVVSPYPESKPVPNYTEIYVTANLSAVTGGHVPSNLFDMKSFGLFQLTFMMWFMGEALCDHVLQNDNIQKLIHSKDLHFDLVIVEAFINECVLGFAHKFNAPIIQVCTYGGGNFMADWVGSPNPYSYVPDEFLHYKGKMNFWERMHNTVVGTLKHVGRHLIHVPKQNAVMQKYFNYTDKFPPVWELEYRTSLVLVNSHFSLSYPKPLSPNYVQVGGMHVKPPKKLPQELQKYLDEAPHGVIYFSMGSNLESSQMPESKRNAILEAFSKLKQHVLWKWETDTLPGQPKNVRLGKWLPQSDILAHPNVRLFITHGGLQSTLEAIIRGVPVVGIPVFADQSLNIERAVEAGYGLRIDFNNITTESLTWALREIIETPKYRENAQRLSQIFRDQPLTPLEQAVFWTEYVIRHKGAPHMRSAALDLAWYQYFLLDVIAALAFAVGFVVVIVLQISRVLLRILFGRKANEANSISRIKKQN